MADLDTLLKRVPTTVVMATLVRAVASKALYPYGEPATPDFLFTSGKANRFNLEGTEALYLSEDEPTALQEYRRQFEGLVCGAQQPVTLFYAEVRLACVLDLTDAEARRALNIKPSQLEADWGSGIPATWTQKLGEAVASDATVAAIRYRSVAAARVKSEGRNLVVFRSCVQRPDFVRILGPTKKPLHRWP